MNKEEKEILQEFVESGKKLNESCEKLRNFLEYENRVEFLESKLTKAISILDKITAGYDYPREYMLALIDNLKHGLHDD